MEPCLLLFSACAHSSCLVHGISGLIAKSRSHFSARRRRMRAAAQDLRSRSFVVSPFAALSSLGDERACEASPSWPAAARSAVALLLELVLARVAIVAGRSSCSSPHCQQRLLSARGVPTTEGKNQMQSRAAFEVVFCCGLVVIPIPVSAKFCSPRSSGTSSVCISVLHLLSAKNQSLLDRGNSFLLLDLFLNVLDLVFGLDVQFDLFAGEGSDSAQLKCS